MKALLNKFFYVITALICAGTVIAGIFFNKIYSYDFLLLTAFVCFGTVLLWAVHFGVKRSLRFFEKNYRFILPVFVVLYLALEIFFGLKLAFTPIYDMGSVFFGAIEWLNTGSFASYYEYFGTFRNNLGILSLLYFIFKTVTKAGVTDYLSTGIVVNSVVIALTAMFTSLNCDKLFGRAAAVTTLFCFIAYMPLIFLSAIFYTDSMTLVFPVAFYYFYLLFKEKESVPAKVCLCVLMAVTIAFGSVIKFTVVIMFIAVAIDALLSVKIRYSLMIILMCSLTIASFNKLLGSYMDNKHLTSEYIRDLKTPLTHWMMMGLSDAGRYNPDDYVYTRSYPIDERSKACVSKIDERLSSMGIKGVAKLVRDKTLVCFTDGTLFESDVLDDCPLYDTPVRNLIMSDGKLYYVYDHCVTGVLFSMYLLTVIACVVRGFVKKDEKVNVAFVLALTGIWAFLMMWETNPRYITNYIPVLIVCAMAGLHSVSEN